MIQEVIKLECTGSLDYARLITYIHNFTPDIGITKRPLVLVCPGGGYKYTSDREAESFALAFMSMGYHSAVIRYSTDPARYPVALTELATAMLELKKHADEWHIDEDKIIVLGCSAGAHLAASLGCLWNDEVLTSALKLDGKTQSKLKPAGMILCYPVITGGEFAHRGSFENLLGEREAELVDSLSLENRVTKDTPPAFIWHTFEDGSVPVENSLLFVQAMRRANIPCEFHLFPKGGHGLGLANNITGGRTGKELQKNCEIWINLAKAWLEDNYPLTYTY